MNNLMKSVPRRTYIHYIHAQILHDFVTNKLHLILLKTLKFYSFRKEMKFMQFSDIAFVIFTYLSANN